MRLWRRWTADELAGLAELYSGPRGKGEVLAFAQKHRRDPANVVRKARRLGLHKGLGPGGWPLKPLETEK